MTELICADSNTWIAFFADATGPDVITLDSSLHEKTAVMSPIVLSELLSDPNLPGSYESRLASIPLLELSDGFWERSGKLRASLFVRKLRPKLADTLIAQLCIDHGVRLLTRDRGFGPFAKYTGLRLG